MNLWKDLLTKLGSSGGFQAKLESMTVDALPQARKRMEEFIETFNHMSNQTIDLFENTLGVYQAASVPEAQRRVQDLIESSLTTLRVALRRSSLWSNPAGVLRSPSAVIWAQSCPGWAIFQSAESPSSRPLHGRTETKR